jgi:hypothetical protein
VTPPKPVKSRIKLGLILGLILGLGIGVGGCLPFVFNFQEKLENETIAKTEVTEQLKVSNQALQKANEEIKSLNEDVVSWKQKFDDESEQRLRSEREVEQVENEKAMAEKERLEVAQQYKDQSDRLAEMKRDIDALRMDKGDLQRENQLLETDLKRSQSTVSLLQSRLEQASRIPASARAAKKDGVMTVSKMTEDVMLPLDGPIHTLRIVDWPSKKLANRFCYESSRNGQKVTLYFNEVPFGTIEHKVLKGEDTLVLSWKEDSSLFYSDRAQKNRDVTFENQVAHQLSQNNIAFLYESKIPNKEKFIELNFVSN